MAKEKSYLRPQKCKFCSNPATKSILWAEGMAYIPCCDQHLATGKSKVTGPMSNKPDPSEIVGIYDIATKRRIDLADLDVDRTSTMVALMIPQEIATKIAVEGGVPAKDLHVIITLHGDLDDAKFNKLVEDLKAWAADAPIPIKLEGEIGGIGAFPAGDNGTPWWVPVDVPGLNTLHEQVRAVADRSAPASSDHGYSPHMTLTYTKPGEPGPEPVPTHRVAFTAIWVVRGNTQRVEIPLTQASRQTSAGDRSGATLAPSNLEAELAEGSLNIMDLAERALAISDPELRRKAAKGVVDLSRKLAGRPDPGKGKTKQGLPSYRRQGKWKHGFVPVDAKAVQSKAKGSPVAKRRIERIFGKKAGSDSLVAPVTVEAIGGGKVTARDASALRGAKAPDIKRTQRVRNSQFEANKVGRVDARATRPWDDIPESVKTVRNGKRFVISNFKGKQVLTEWQGGVREGETKNTTKYKSLTSADAKKMSTAELRKILKDSNTPRAVKQVAYRALQAKIKLGAQTA